MASHVATIKWAAKESGEEFLKGRFSRVGPDPEISTNVFVID